MAEGVDYRLFYRQVNWRSYELDYDDKRNDGDQPNQFRF